MFVWYVQWKEFPSALYMTGTTRGKNTSCPLQHLNGEQHVHGENETIRGLNWLILDEYVYTKNDNNLQ